ncbi:MAG: Chagasin family peptidase inhibitor [Mucilaginibacter sp.]|uniref:protease inhibitor I42 family protein n=1 Tax=Mucilaginibacter sp. TaxID=1882438 RepID=UPI00262AFA8E|nr:protease inhibitor I42 family protein [Mucilaginibacter sp.]MDB5002210.1 Chagasin family peptidase inhibitor [Mucilaginibacter sp.]
MKKTSITLALLFFAALFALVSCKKDYSDIVKLSNADTAKITTVQKGKVIYVTLEFGNSPYYEPGSWEFDTSVLNVVTHGHINPPAGLIGSAGTDTWTFNTLTTGTTTIKLRNSGFGGSSKILFNSTIKVE